MPRIFMERKLVGLILLSIAAYMLIVHWGK